MCPTGSLMGNDATEILGKGASDIWGSLILYPKVWSNDAAADGVDSHITLFYADQRLIQAWQEKLLPAMQRYLAACPQDNFAFRAAMNWDYAKEGYAWIDILAATPLYATLKRVISAGVGDGHALRVWKRDVPIFNKISM